METSNVVRVSSRKKQIVFEDVPKTHTIVTKHYLSKVVNESKKLKSIMKKINSNRFHPTPECRQMMGSAAAIAPKASQDALQNVTPLLLGGILHNVVIAIDCNELPNICPS